MNDIHCRLKKIVEYSGLARTEFAKKCGINYNTISSGISGAREVNLEIVQKVLAAYPEIEEGWLILGRGSMLSPKVEAALKNNQ